ncbi:hypothetical protein BAE44_0004385 [Dichanthelium oligosanthes]|uniref:DUF868 domain-containing protein n=1 Tax=Dichanthelium oligosanthes TaxID=888268 RepID=A0A1E5WB36_9POAL|nr:hypothetical protein BAE44_0004385 [Dichanthelium oligosanthes]
MPLSCFARRAGGGGGVPSPSPVPSSSATSVYWTHLGAVTLTWSRAPIGLLLSAELRLAGDDADGDDDDDAAPARFALRPWLPWRRRGSKRFAAPGGRTVAFSWDLSSARFAAAGRRPEPSSRYSLLVSIDGELALAIGDGAPPASAGLLLSRRESAVADGPGEAYATTVDVAGVAHEVSLAVEDSAMWVAIDGEKALQVRRLRWKFRGSERLDLPRGRVRVTWDLHGWLFSPDAAAVFVLRFETSDADEEDDDKDVEEDAGTHALVRQSSFRNHHAGGGESWCSSDSDRRGWRRGPFRSGSDTSPSVSVASTSATSSAGSVATVSEWAAAEEAVALKDGSGFSLVVQLWKKRR